MSVGGRAAVYRLPGPASDDQVALDHQIVDGRPFCARHRRGCLPLRFCSLCLSLDGLLCPTCWSGLLRPDAAAYGDTLLEAIESHRLSRLSHAIAHVGVHDLVRCFKIPSMVTWRPLDTAIRTSDLLSWMHRRNSGALWSGGPDFLPAGAGGWAQEGS